VYSTSCGQDHWLLGLQYVFKVHKDPLISRVEMGPDRTLRVTITSRGRQDKFASPNTPQAEELLRAMEAAAVKAAEVCMQGAGGEQCAGNHRELGVMCHADTDRSGAGKKRVMASHICYLEVTVAPLHVSHPHVQLANDAPPPVHPCCQPTRCRLL
jgi:hypothetical protein